MSGALRYAASILQNTEAISWGMNGGFAQALR